MSLDRLEWPIDNRQDVESEDDSKVGDGGSRDMENKKHFEE